MSIGARMQLTPPLPPCRKCNLLLRALVNMSDCADDRLESVPH
jgi:hypothetical protein